MYLAIERMKNVLAADKAEEHHHFTEEVIQFRIRTLLPKRCLAAALHSKEENQTEKEKSRRKTEESNIVPGCRSEAAGPRISR